MQHFAKGDARQRQETRSYVTPYKFSVAKEMLGTPLATPVRRATALFVDLCLVALLTHVSSTVLAVFVAVVFFQAARNQHSQTLKRTRKLLRFAAAIVIAVVVFDVSDSVLNKMSEPNVAVSSDAREAPANEAEDHAAMVALAEAPFKGINALTESLSVIIKDFGMGLGWAALYFSVLTAWFAGQTPGKRLFGIKVVKLDGKPLTLWESFGRYGGYSAGLATGLMGFVQVCWDPNRQAIQDKISETLVIDMRKARQTWNTDVKPTDSTAR